MSQSKWELLMVDISILSFVPMALRLMTVSSLSKLLEEILKSDHMECVSSKMRTRDWTTKPEWSSLITWDAQGALFAGHTELHITVRHHYKKNFIQAIEIHSTIANFIKLLCHFQSRTLATTQIQLKHSVTALILQLFEVSNFSSLAVVICVPKIMITLSWNHCESGQKMNKTSTQAFLSSFTKYLRHFHQFWS